MSQPLTKAHSSSYTPFVVAVIGGNNVGKTTLSRNLSEAAAAESTNEGCSIFHKEVPEKGCILHYKDYSSLSLKLIEDLPTESPQMLLALFRDSVSYGQLYEFFQNVTAQTEGGAQSVRAFWEDLDNLVLVYSEVEGQKEVQIDQLFGILIEQIRNFNRTAAIKQFVLKRDPDNHQYLRQLIEKTLPSPQIREDLPAEDERSAGTGDGIQVQLAQVEDKSEQLNEISAQKISIQQEIRNEEKSPQQQLRDSLPQQYIQKNEILISQLKRQEHQASTHQQPILESQLSQQPQTQVESNLPHVEQKRSSPEESQQPQQILPSPIHEHSPRVQRREDGGQQQMEGLPQEGDLPELELASSGKQAQPIQNTEAERLDSMGLCEEIGKEQEHYQQVYDRLMRKITAEDIQDARKDSYKNLFQEFRRTSKEESKISKELHQYWKQKIERLEEQEEEESEKHEAQVSEQDQLPQEEQEEASLQTGQQSAVEAKGGKGEGQKQLLKPQTGYEKRPPHRQKSTAETKPCMCQIM